ncbi:MAG: hypothetical protein WCV80_02535 [Candidatus Paceibacterota bacterium]|jgi:hypothetical protein
MAEVSPPTQQFVNIKEVKNGVIYLKHGGIRKILMVSGINFDLKSEDEQNLILNTFQNFINTLDFGIQFFIHSRKTNINAYLDFMRQRQAQEDNGLLKIQIDDYIEFIRSFVEQNAIINKTFFAVVPYESVLVGASAGGFLGLFKPQTSAAKIQSDQATLEQLDHRVSQVAEGLEQIGLHVSPLSDEEIIELFYNLYNPQLVEKKGLEIAKQ